MSITTTNKKHFTAIAYTATFLGLLLILFLIAVFFTSSKPRQEVNKAPQQEAASQIN